jgi:hypothetical protein
MDPPDPTEVTMPLKPSPLVLFLLALPFQAAYGLLVLIGALVRLPGRLRALSAALGDELICPNGHANRATGRFECASCHAVYHGWIGKCGHCGAPAGWTPCGTCGVAVALPWERW